MLEETRDKNVFQLFMTPLYVLGHIGILFAQLYRRNIAYVIFKQRKKNSFILLSLDFILIFLNSYFT